MKQKIKKDFSFIFQNTKKDWLNLAILLAINFFMVFLNFEFPVVQSLIVDYGLNLQPELAGDGGIFSFFFSGAFGEIGSLSLVVSLAVCFFLIIFLTNILKYLQGSLTTLFKTKNRVRLRKKTFEKFCRCNANFSNGELITLLNEDTAGLGDFFFTSIPAILADVFTLVMAVLTLTNINPYLLIVPLITCPILFTFCIIYIKKLYDSQLTIREETAQIKSLMQDNLEGMKTIKLFNQTSLSRQRFKKKNIEYTTSIADKNLLTNKYNLIFNIVKKVSYIVSLIVGGLLAIDNRISIGQFLVFTTFVVSLLDAITTICCDIANSKLYILQNRKLQDFFNCEDDIVENVDAIEINTKQNYNITFENVNLHLGDKKILDNISIFLPRGKSLGIIGSPGNGKSAIIKTMQRILKYDGSIKIGETEIKDLTIKNLRDLISYHTQNPSLFNITVRENLLYSGSKKSDIEINAVLKAIHAKYFLNEVSLDFLVYDCGNMFGDNKVRLSIARAILKESPVYIFDDFTYGYSTSEKKTLCKNIINLLPEKSTIFVSENFEDVKACDFILQLDGGKVKYFGKTSHFKETEEGK